MKNTKKEEIKKIIKKQRNKINIPFFNFDKSRKNVEIFPSTILKVLPEFLEKEKTEEKIENFSKFLTNSAVFPKTTKLKPITQPIFFNSTKKEQKIIANYNKDSLRPQLTANNFKKTTILPIASNKKIYFPSKIEAKLEPNATSAGGIEQAKLVTIQKPNNNKKELVLVGEKGKETINHIDNSIVPIDLIKQIQTKTTLVPTTNSKSKIETTLVPTTNSKSKIETTLVPTTNSKSKIREKTNSIKIKAKNDFGHLTDVLVSTNDAKSILSMVKNKSISNDVKLNNKNIEIETPAHFLGMLSKLGKTTGTSVGKISKNLKASAKNLTANLKSNSAQITSNSSNLSNIGTQYGEKSSLTTPSSGMEPLPTAQAEEQEKNSGGLLGGIAAAAGGLLGGLGTGLGVMSGLGAGSSMLGKGIKELLNSGGEAKTVPPIVQSNSANPTTVTTILNQYDTYRKTADDSFMLPNYRREYG